MEYNIFSPFPFWEGFIGASLRHRDRFLCLTAHKRSVTFRSIHSKLSVNNSANGKWERSYLKKIRRVYQEENE